MWFVLWFCGCKDSLVFLTPVESNSSDAGAIATRACSRSPGEINRVASYATSRGRVVGALAADAKAIYLIDAFSELPTPGSSQIFAAPWCGGELEPAFELAAALNNGGRPVLALSDSMVYVATNADQGSVYQWPRDGGKASQLAKGLGETKALARFEDGLVVLSQVGAEQRLSRLSLDGGTSLLTTTLSSDPSPRISALEGTIAFTASNPTRVFLWTSGVPTQAIFTSDTSASALALDRASVWLSDRDKVTHIDRGTGLSQTVATTQIDSLGSAAAGVYGSGPTGQYRLDKTGLQQVSSIYSRLLAVTNEGLVIAKALDGGSAEVFVVTP